MLLHIDTMTTPNHGARWSIEQDDWLLMAIRKKSIDYCAQKMGRTPGSIQGRLKLLAYQKIREQGLTVQVAAELVCLPIAVVQEYCDKQQVTKPKESFYAVRKGHVPGIYSSWDECQAQTQGFSGCQYKKFKTHEEACTYMKNEELASPPMATAVKYALSAEQQKVIDLIKAGRNVFLTGQAGTGKTTTIHSVCEYAYARNMMYGITATTGCAAVLIGGKTLHSFLGIGLASRTAESLAYFTKSRNPKVFERLVMLRLLIIDEISMMNAELFTKISRYLSLVRGIDKPFGGVQVLLSGDFAQLPPVNGDYCFETQEWDAMDIQKVLLTTQFRQGKDQVFQTMLQRLRIGECSDEDLALLQATRDTVFSEDIIPTRLFPLNRSVDKINQDEFDKLVQRQGEDQCRVYKPKFVVHTIPIKTLKQFAETCGIPEELKLCVGAQVIVTWNINDQIVNGTRGCIVKLDKNTVYIHTLTNGVVPIHMVETSPEMNTKDKVIFMPLRLGYALSIHKSQGMTLDAVEMNLGSDIFEYGQAYVALSRAKSLDSVRILNVQRRSFMTNPKVLAFYS